MRFARLARKFEGLQFGHQFFWNWMNRWRVIVQNMLEDFFLEDCKMEKSLCMILPAWIKLIPLHLTSYTKFLYNTARSLRRGCLLRARIKKVWLEKRLGGDLGEKVVYRIARNGKEILLNFLKTFFFHFVNNGDTRSWRSCEVSIFH